MAPNNGWTYHHRVAPAGAGLTLADYLTVTFSHSPQVTWLLRIAAGEVDVDGAVRPASTPLRAGQLVTWRRPPWEEPDVPLSFAVLFEDEWILAVAKPSGLPTLPAGGFLEHTLLALVRRRDPKASPLHRLGRHTSGLVLFARDGRVAAAISSGWRSVRKHYRALGSGVAGWSNREINVGIGRVQHARLGTVHAAHPAGKPSRSLARVVERRAGSTLFDVEILSGRPHQVRIHLAWAGHPLVGDPLYGPGGRPLTANAGLPGDGGYGLHASRLTLVHPVTRAPLELECGPPPALRKAAETGAEPR